MINPTYSDRDFTLSDGGVLPRTNWDEFDVESYLENLRRFEDESAKVEIVVMINALYYTGQSLAEER